MADFRAKITADADLKNATSAIDSFVNQTRKLQVDVDLKLTNAGQNLTNMLNQLQGQARSAGANAGAQWSSGFNSSLGNIDVSATAKQITNLQTALGKTKFDSSTTTQIVNGLDNMSVAVEKVQAKMKKGGGINLSVKGTDEMERTVTVMKNFKKSGDEASSTISIMAKAAKAQKEVSKSQLEIAGNNLTAWASSNSKAAASYGEQIRLLQERLQDMKTNGATQDVFKTWQEDVKVMQSGAKATGNIGKTFTDSFGSAFNSMLKFAASYVSIRKVFSEMENGIKTVVALDDALVDLQKTTTATPQQLNAFYNEANGIAKQYGTTTQQIIQGAAD